MRLKLITLILGVGFTLNALSFEAVRLWESQPVFNTPESITYYAEKKQLFVSNIGGSPLKKDGNGFISIVDLKGHPLTLKWVTGLNAPKGSAYFKNILVVSDIDRIAVIDIEKATIAQFIDIPEARFLNDVTVDRTGNFYISDTSPKNSVIYRFDGKKISVWLEGNQVNTPNGLSIEGDKLFYGSSKKNTIYSADLLTKETTLICDTKRGIDGLEIISADCYLTSDWSGHVTVTCKDKPMLILDTTSEKVNAADLEYIKEDSLIIIPTFFDNRIMGYRLTGGNE